MMDKKENLLKMLRGEPHDHVPVSFFHHFRSEDTAGEHCVEAHVKFFRDTDLDWIKIMHDGLTAPCSLTAKTLTDLDDYRSKKGQNAYVRAYLERAKGVNDRIGNEVYTYVNLFTPFTLLRRIGDERLASFIRQDRQKVKDILQWMADDISYLAEHMITEAGCLGVFIAMQGAETGLMSREDFYELLDPCDRQVAETASAASPYNILHFCGWNEIPNHLEYWKDYPGNTVNWAIGVDDLTLAEGRRYFGGRNVLGGFDNRRGRLLYCGSREEITAETFRILDAYREAFGNTDSLMIGGDCSYLTDFERTRFNWVTEAVKAYEHRMHYS